MFSNCESILFFISQKSAIAGNIKDILTDVKLMLGGIRDTQHYRNVKKLTQEAMNKFDKVDISGYSLGGGMSYSVGQELDIPSLSLNPLIGRNVISELGPQNIARNIAREAGYYGSPVDRMGRQLLFCGHCWNAKHYHTCIYCCWES